MAPCLEFQTFWRRTGVGRTLGRVRCPTCHQHTPDAWKLLRVDEDDQGRDNVMLHSPDAASEDVTVEWMRCANDKCEELIIRIEESYPTSRRGWNRRQTTAHWVARPRGAQRAVDSAVPEPLKKAYLEAASILDLSPRMSAVLSRRVLADVLEEYAGLDQFSLNSRIEAFSKDTQHPSRLRANMHHLREIGDFGAHTQRDKDDQARIIDVTREEADWTLDLIDRLFDHFIVGPASDEAMRAKIDQNIEDANRRAIEPIDDGTDAS